MVWSVENVYVELSTAPSRIVYYWFVLNSSVPKTRIPVWKRGNTFLIERRKFRKANVFIVNSNTTKRPTATHNLSKHFFAENDSTFNEYENTFESRFRYVCAEESPKIKNKKTREYFYSITTRTRLRKEWGIIVGSHRLRSGPGSQRGEKTRGNT